MIRALRAWWRARRQRRAYEAREAAHRRAIAELEERKRPPNYRLLTPWHW